MRGGPTCIATPSGVSCVSLVGGVGCVSPVGGASRMSQGALVLKGFSGVISTQGLEKEHSGFSPKFGVSLDWGLSN